MVGSYGTSSHNWEAYVAQIYDMGFATTVQENKPASNLKSYPNPVVDMFTVDFSLTKEATLGIGVFDMQGRMVKTLYSGFCHDGENTFSFNKSNLRAGTYFLEIRSDQNTILHEKIVIAD
jgi:hypothetical protein